MLRISSLKRITIRRAALVASAAAIVLCLEAGCSGIERKLLFYPTHGTQENGLTPWMHENQLIGYSRQVKSPKNIWLMMHGNAGQASDRTYALPCFSPEDSVFILEYPGFGTRKGVPSRTSFNQAAEQAYQLLRQTYPNVPVCVIGESIGTGPASSLGNQQTPPDKIVLVVPYDRLRNVATDHYPSFVVSALLKDDWNNIEALSSYKGPIDLFGAESDRVIPVSHAKALAAALPGSKLVIVNGGHNDWSSRVQIRNP